MIKKIQKISLVGFLALGLMLVASPANAAITVAVNSITETGALTITTAVGSAGNLFTTTTTGAINIGTSLTTGDLTLGGAQTSGAITIGGGVQTGTITLGGGTGAQTVNVGTGDTGAKTINIGTSAVANTITLGNVTGATALTINTGTGGFAVNTTGTGDITLTTADDFTLVGASGSLLTIGSAAAGLRYYEETSAPNGDTAVAATESGSTIYVGAAGDDFTLPAAADGLVFRFVVDTLYDTTAMTIVSTEGDNIEGTLVVASDVVACVGEDKVNIIETAESIGDWVELRSNGTSWFVSGVGVTAGSLTCTDPS